jgi:actin-like ATPase involved in cell morphogenesis
VAAVDLGTHGTGIGWCVVSDLNDDPMTRRVVIHPKDLTAILVDREGGVVAVGHRARQKWMKAADAGNAEELSYAYAFKMTLARQLIAAYLGEVRKAALAEICAAGYTEPEIRWCVTVPAIWDEGDKAVIRAAAADAGFPDDDDRLLLSIQPEAAALYCYLRMADLDGTRFMVIDCGGGTVDITAYESPIGATANIALREIGVATGGQLGSEYVNQAFRANVLTRRFSVEAMERIERENAAGLLALSEAWEREKATVGVELDAEGTPHIADPVTIDIPPTVWTMLDEATKATLTDEMAGRPYLLELSPEEVETLFETVTTGILGKVEEQLASMRRTAGAAPGPETLVLVGGFAQSAWLQMALRRRFGGRHRILVPQNPDRAVLEGAVHYAYNPAALISRQSKYTYGFAIAAPWEPGVDSPVRKFRDDDGHVLCTGRYQVAVRRMDRVGVDEPFGFVVAPTMAEQSEIEVRLFRTRKRDPRYVDEDGCDPIGQMTVDVSDSVGLAPARRPIQLLLYFGRAHIQVTALNPATHEETRVSADFERML